MTRSFVLLAFTAAFSWGCSDDVGSGGSGLGGSDESGGGSTNAGCESGPLAAPIDGCSPAALPTSGDPHEDCVNRINQLRWECQCLPPLARWTEAESCSDGQAAADQSAGVPHNGSGECGELAQNTCPDWPSEGDVIGGCLQSMWDEGPGEPFSEHGHYINMSNTDYSKVACGFANDGATWSNQNFAP